MVITNYESKLRRRVIEEISKKIMTETPQICGAVFAWSKVCDSTRLRKYRKFSGFYERYMWRVISLPLSKRVKKGHGEKFTFKRSLMVTINRKFLFWIKATIRLWLMDSFIVIVL